MKQVHCVGQQVPYHMCVFGSLHRHPLIVHRVYFNYWMLCGVTGDTKYVEQVGIWNRFIVWASEYLIICVCWFFAQASKVQNTQTH